MSAYKPDGPVEWLMLNVFPGCLLAIIAVACFMGVVILLGGFR